MDPAERGVHVSMGQIERHQFTDIHIFIFVGKPLRFFYFRIA